MKHNSTFRRGMSALVALVLMFGMAMGQNDLVITGTTSISNSGTIKVKGNITNAGVAGATTIGGTVHLKKAGAQAIGTASNGAINFATLVIPSTGDNTKTFNVNSAVSSSIDIAASAGATSQYDLNGNTLSVGGTIANTGTASTPYVFSASGSTVNYTGGAQTVYATGGLTYYNLTVSAAGGDKTLGGDVTVSNALTVSNTGVLAISNKTLTINGNTYDLLTGGTVKGGTTSNLTMNGSGDLTSFSVTNGLNNFTLNRVGNTATLGADLSVEGAVTLTAGTLAVSTQTLTLNGTGAVVTGAGTLSSAATGTVNYAANGQNVFTANYGHLTFGAGLKTFPNATVGIAGTLTKGTATYAMGTGTVDFNGGGAQNIPLFTFNNLITSNAGTKTATGNLTVGGTFDNSVTLLMDTYTLAITGGKDNTGGTIKFAGAANGVPFNTGIISYNGDIAQAVTAGAYNDLRFETANVVLTNRTLTGVTVSTASNLTVPQYISLALNGASTLNITGTSTLTVNGDLQNAGTIDIGD
ncbi:MAG: beta strand repeat-containing protein [Bacteroidota bacterium]